jgi:hypothetical protein
VAISVRDQDPPRIWMYPTLLGESINWLDARVLFERAGVVAGHAAPVRLHIQHFPSPENHWLPPNLFPTSQQGQVIPPSSWHEDVQAVQE